MPRKTDSREIETLRHNFKNYLLEQEIKSEDTKVSDAFYLYRHDHTIDFFELLQIRDERSFHQEAHEHLYKTLREKSAAKGDNLSAYMLAITLLWKSVHNDAIPAKTTPVPDRKTVADVTHIPRPSCDEADKYLRRWDTDEYLFKPDAALKKLFTKTHPQNTLIDDIILKATALNTVYNTYITSRYSVYPVAQHILELNIDERLGDGDETLVNELMRVLYRDGKKIDHYSFATKYCSFHNPDAFPIYDSFVAKILWHFQQAEGFAVYGKGIGDIESYKTEVLKDYPTFKCVLNEFRRHFGLEKYTPKELDQYLWQFGKEYF